MTAAEASAPTLDETPKAPDEGVPDEAAAAAALRWTASVVVMTTLFLLVFNAASLKSWANGLAPSDATVALRGYADRWEATTERWGVAAPRDAVHAAWTRAVALKWGGTSPEAAAR